ncbi:MAG: hypothetical protein ACKVU1_11510 [bacterium]
MKVHTKKRIAALAFAGALLAAAGPLVADETAEVPWEQAFNGHEMWLTSLDEAIAKSTSSNKPLLIDFYSHT